MTGAGPDPARLVGTARLLLLDFDGPVTRLFVGQEWLTVSAQVRRLAGERGGPALARALGQEPDHVQCLRVVGRHHPGLLAGLESGCRRLEVAAATRVRPWPAAVTLIEATLARGAAVAVVTNNAPEVVAPVLDRARPGLSRRLTGVFGRSRDTVADLKPAPDLLLRALATAGVDPPGAVFVGDSVTDVLAGTAAGVPVVGLHEAADRRAELAAAGAVAVVADIADLLDESREPGSR